MAFFQINREVQGGNELGAAMDAFRTAWYGLANVAGHLAAQSNSQVTEYYGFDNDIESGSAKSELLSGIGHLQNGDVNLDGAEIKAALVQMLNQFG